ncbi:hypothetical protein [Phytopseudomonas punonensis]|uniref:hypothetical protein n=1 Tax=Phytopseudomonas punonensis TaxID=1220495 RepID=UPI0011149DCB|nr:hypothetical protein [Pseudomonas punonensis]
MLCLLALALPAQGIAAAGMQAGMTLSVGGHEHRMHLSGDMDSCGAACSHHQAPSEQKAPGHATCSLCVFCVGVIALSPAIFSATQLPLDRPLAVWHEHFIEHIADTPYRPPRVFIG